MPSLRIQRVQELLKREIGEIIRREFAVQEVGLVTVNAVEVSADLHQATVFVSILGKPEDQKRAFDILLENQKRIQGIMARNIVLKYTPRLRFVQDDSVVRGNRVLQIIKELEQSSEQ